jgi:adenylate cyclase, class 2
MLTLRSGHNSQMTVHTGVETEIKIRVGDVEEIEGRLRTKGFEESSPRSFEANTMWDTPERMLRASGEIVRVRDTHGKHILTYKGKAQTSKYKTREELEAQMTDTHVLARVFDRLGLKPMFRYEKYRTEYRRHDGDGVVTVDETPIGNFIELEGSPEWIDYTASELGFSDADYSTKSYGALYIEFCERQGIEPQHMVFPR